MAIWTSIYWKKYGRDTLLCTNPMQHSFDEWKSIAARMLEGM